MNTHLADFEAHLEKGTAPAIPMSKSVLLLMARGFNSGLQFPSRMVRCTDKRCKVCPKAEGRRVLFSTVSNTPYTFHDTFTCAERSLMYCIVCNKCGKLYIGLTSKSLKTRFRAHRYSSKRDEYPCTATFLGDRTTFLETIGSFC